jgi:hypothetical protein
MISQIGGPLSRRPPPNMPPNMPMRMSIAASMAKKLATVMIRTSRLAMWESSCASTPSISRGSSRFQRPCVTATAACLGLRPVANALGTSVGMTATRGFGRSDMAQRRSTMSCSSGASSRLTTFAPEALRASLSEVKYWKNASAPRSTIIGTSPKSKICTMTMKNAT